MNDPEEKTESKDLEGKIVFSSGRTGDFDIWSLDLGSKELLQLTTGSDWNDMPRWSPDGLRVAFISNRSGVQELWLMNESVHTTTSRERLPL